MFELLFRYPARLFEQGEFVFLSRAPLWLLAVAILLAMGGLALLTLRTTNLRWPRWRQWSIWGLQSLMATLLLVLLWQPALRVSALKAQQNVIAVIVDDSKSMATREGTSTRIEQARRTLDDGLLGKLRERFAVRLYRGGASAARVETAAELQGTGTSTRLADTLTQAVIDASALPVGAIVLLSDGADNAGGIDLQSLSEVRRLRIPIHTIGYGRERLDRDAELTSVELAPRTIKGSLSVAQVTFRQRGYGGGKARLVARAENKVLATREVILKQDGEAQTESMALNAGDPGPRTIEFALEGLSGEENPANNTLRRLVTVEANRPRILYLEGEPRWDYKFIRRAFDDDSQIDLASVLRTTQNKIYRQGIQDPQELEAGFPAKPEELFPYRGLIIGGVEASYFTPTQQELIKQFVDRRGGGLLFLAGRSGLADGGYQASSTFLELLPVTLPDRKNTFKREPANVELTGAGRDSLITRLDDATERNADRWKKLPHLANYQEVGPAKPGASVLVESLPTSKGRWPLLATQSYGRGRVAMLATGGTWRWKMQLDHADRTHATFWQQLGSWLVQGAPPQVSLSTPRGVLSDEQSVELRGEIRDKAYRPVSNATVDVRITTPDGSSTTIPMTPEPLTEGVFTAKWSAVPAGSYVAEMTARRGEEELGRDVLNFRREDGVAENFGIEQNRELLEKLASETGGRYYTPSQSSQLANEITYSEAGLTVRESRDLWNMPVVFLLLLTLRAAEWLLRRKWGAV